MTYTDALNYIITRITHDASADAPFDGAQDALLTVTLTRFAIHCANLPGAMKWLDLFIGEFYSERGRLNHLASSAKADANQIRNIRAMIGN